MVDTHLSIDWLNAGTHEPILFQPEAVKFMSAVVMMELFAGVHALRDRTRLHDLFRTFTKLGRMITPSAETYHEAGEVLRQLQIAHKYRLRPSHSLAKDVLIVLSARAVG